MRNLQKNLNTIWQPPPFLDKPPHFAYPPFSSKNFQTPPFPSIFKKSTPPLHEGGGGGVRTMLPFWLRSISVELDGISYSQVFVEKPF